MYSRRHSGNTKIESWIKSVIFDIDVIEISLKGSEQYEVLIVDLMGRIAHRSTLNAQGDIIYNVNTSKLGNGIYNVVFQNKNERVIRRLVVK